MHFIEDERHAAGITQFAQVAEDIVWNGANAPLALHRLDDHRCCAVGRDNTGCRLGITKRNDLHTWEQRLERPAIVGAIGRREGREQTTMEGSPEGDDVALAGPLPGELERAFVRLCAGIAEEGLTARWECAARQLRGEPLARFGPVEIRDVDQPRVERAHDSVAEDRTVVAESIDGDARHKVEIARAVFGNQLRAFSRDEVRSNARIDAEQRAGVRADERRGHAG